LHIADSTSNNYGIDIQSADNVVVIGCYLFTDYGSPNHDDVMISSNTALAGINISSANGIIVGGASGGLIEFIRVGYSTDLPLSNVAFKNLGTHEFSLNINFAAFKKQVVVVPRYF
jgi:hypothetical protein